MTVVRVLLSDAIARRDKEMEEVSLRLQRQRQGEKDYFDATHATREENLIKEGDLVLLWPSSSEKDASTQRSFEKRWTGRWRKPT